MHLQGIDLLEPRAQGRGVERQRERPPVADPAHQRGRLVAVEHAVTQIARRLGEERRVGPVATSIRTVAASAVRAIETLALRRWRRRRAPGETGQEQHEHQGRRDPDAAVRATKHRSLDIRRGKRRAHAALVHPACQAHDAGSGGCLRRSGNRRSRLHTLALRSPGERRWHASHRRVMYRQRYRNTVAAPGTLVSSMLPPSRDVLDQVLGEPDPAVVSRRPVISAGMTLNHWSRWPGAHGRTGSCRRSSDSRSMAPVMSRQKPCTATLHPW